ncbi:hypothetical protein AB0H57_09070 [Micromonospora sp. NPDC050686]|uniref:hypothetical protein n=1 Tax=Micromonospora sp. NPDC050686 TaxID=3154631 RepID=UPI0033D4F3E6
MVPEPGLPPGEAKAMAHPAIPTGTYRLAGTLRVNPQTPSADCRLAREYAPGFWESLLQVFASSNGGLATYDIIYNTNDGALRLQCRRVPQEAVATWTEQATPLVVL